MNQEPKPKPRITLTPEQRYHLETAISRARAAGQCRYVEGGAPACVIGQLASLEGVTIDVLAEWDAQDNSQLGVLVRTDVEGTIALDPYPLDLLLELQQAWDCADGSRPYMNEDGNVDDEKVRADTRLVLHQWVSR